MRGQKAQSPVFLPEDPRVYDASARVRALQGLLLWRVLMDCRGKPGNGKRKSEIAAQ